MSLVLLSVAGAVGAVSRYVVSSVAQMRSRSTFPVGTLVVNLSGAFALGLVVGLEGLESQIAIAIFGFLGGFTTFSTWMIETIRLPLGSWRSIVNLALPLIGGVVAAYLGYAISS